MFGAFIITCILVALLTIVSMIPWQVIVFPICFFIIWLWVYETFIEEEKPDYGRNVEEDYLRMEKEEY